MNGKYGRWILSLTLIIGALGCAQTARGVEPSFLIYCDKSPGAVPHAIALQDRIEGQNGTWTYATGATQFESRLAQGNWTGVYVLAKHSTSEPAYASDLRDYANANSNQPITMFIWKEHTTLPAADLGVLATTSLVVWLNGYTTTNYALRADSPQNPTNSVSGLVFPDFQGVQTRQYTDFGVFSEEIEGGETQSLFFAPPIPPCLLACIQSYLNRVNICQDDFQTHMDGAQVLYGPSENNQGNPAQFTAELKKAATDLVNCQQAALNQWNICIALCNA